MKKAVFLDLENNARGGVARVNSSLASGFEERGYKVFALYLAENKDDHFPISDKAEVFCAENSRRWEYTRGEDVKSALSESVFKSAKLFFCHFSDKRRLSRNLLALKKKITDILPDIIIVSHYILLDAVPEAFFSRTTYHIHTSFEATVSNKANLSALEKYNGKIKFVWLSDALAEKAKKNGFSDSVYIYNPVPFSSEKTADTANNRRFIVMSRFSPEKRIPEMVLSVKKVLRDGWRLYIYGSGTEEENIRLAAGDDERIVFAGTTSDPLSAFLSASVNLNTSLFEGFPMSILEAAAAGVPTVSFEFGDGAREEIIDNKTGIIVPMSDFTAFENALSDIMDDPEKLKKLSDSAKTFSKSFALPKIIDEWEKLFISQNPNGMPK